MATRLKTLNLHMCNSIGDVRFRMGHGGTIGITKSRVGDEDLKRFLASCEGLHTFVYKN